MSNLLEEKEFFQPFIDAQIKRSAKTPEPELGTDLPKLKKQRKPKK